MPSFREAVQRWKRSQQDRLRAAGSAQMPGGIWVTPPRLPSKPTPLVSVFATHQMLLINPLVRAKIGFFTPSDTVHKLAEPVSDEGLGSAVRLALQESEAMPTRDAINRSRPARRASGLRTQREFMNGARLVDVLAEDHRIVVTPTRNESPRSPRSNFFAIEPKRTLDGPSDAELGMAVRSALADCTFAEPRKRRARKPE
jgi:hypothetical protein